MTSDVSYYVEQGAKFLNGTAELAERICNVGACIPVVGHYFIAVHGVMGGLQVIKGVALAIIGYLGELATEYGGCDDEIHHCFTVTKITAKEHVKHGFANVALSAAQFAIGFFTFNLGNLILPAVAGTFGPLIVKYP
ncbi:MAG: hypothetical protein ACXWM7_06635 [Parachlamydiaceae bacterium]